MTRQLNTFKSFLKDILINPRLVDHILNKTRQIEEEDIQVKHSSTNLSYSLLRKMNFNLNPYFSDDGLTQLESLYKA